MTVARIEDVADGFVAVGSQVRDLTDLIEAVSSDVDFILPNTRKINTSPNRAPLPTDDADIGYQPGSRWQWGGREWVATDTTPDAAKWRPVYTPYVTDWDTIQASLDWLAITGGEVVVPVGVHTLTEPLNLAKLGPAGIRAVLRGQGQSSILQFNGVAGDAIYGGSGSVPGAGLGWELQELRIRGQVGVDMTGIFLENANSAKIKDVWFQTMQDAIRMSDTYGVRITDCHATGLTRDFVRLAERTFLLVLRDNGGFGVGDNMVVPGYFLHCPDTVGSLVNIVIDSNDIEVVGGVIKSNIPIYGLRYTSNYMEQSAGQVFDFNAPVYGQITGGNTLQMSGAQTIDNFFGEFTFNHLFDIQFSWGSNSYPTATGGNFLSGTATLQRKPKRTLTINPAYMNQASYEVLSVHKDSAERVYLQGNARRDTTAVPSITLPYLLTTLPAGYRPALTQTFSTVGTGNAPARIRVATNGDVFVEANAASDASVGLGGISFQAAS